MAYKINIKNTIKLTKIIDVNHEIYSTIKFTKDATFVDSLEIIQDLNVVKIVIFTNKKDMYNNNKHIKSSIYIPLNQIKYMENKEYID